MGQPNDKYKIIVSGKAKQMLTEHTAFLARVSVNAANNLISSFKEASSSLESMPQRCPWFNKEYLPQYQYRSMLFDKRYLIIFQIQGNTVYIDYVIDCRQDYSWLIS